MIMVPGIPRDSSPFSVSLSIVCSSGRSTRLMQTIIGPISPLQCGLSRTTNVLLEKLQVVHPHVIKLLSHIVSSLGDRRQRNMADFKQELTCVPPIHLFFELTGKNSRISTIVYGQLLLPKGTEWKCLPPVFQNFVHYSLPRLLSFHGFSCQCPINLLKPMRTYCRLQQRVKDVRK